MWGLGTEGGISPIVGRKFVLACCYIVKLTIKVLKLQRDLSQVLGAILVFVA